MPRHEPTPNPLPGWRTASLLTCAAGAAMLAFALLAGCGGTVEEPAPVTLGSGPLNPLARLSEEPPCIELRDDGSEVPCAHLRVPGAPTVSRRTAP